MSEILDGKRLVMGTCYYPEHWPENLWKEDLQRMLDTGIEVIRIAEFAWSKVEPTEGNYTYEFFDRFLDLADEMGMKVIFCSFVHRLQRNLPLTTEAVNALLAGRLTMSLTVKRIFFTQKAIQRHSANFCRRNMAPWIH